MSDDIEKNQSKIKTLHLSQVDIEKGVKVVTIGFNQYYDCTEVLNDVFLSCAEEARKHEIIYPNLLLLANPGLGWIEGLTIPSKAVVDFNNLMWFKSKVNHGAEWDVKIENSWNNTVGVTFPGPNGSIVFWGDIYTISEIGNILYGYTGTAMNIPEEILYIGGGYAAVGLEFVFYEGYGDLEDRDAIKEGIEWYKSEY